MEKIDWKSLDKDSLNTEVVRLKREFFNLRLNGSVGQVKDYSQFKKVRKDIARALTFLRRKDQG